VRALGDVVSAAIVLGRFLQTFAFMPFTSFYFLLSFVPGSPGGPLWGTMDVLEDRVPGGIFVRLLVCFLFGFSFSLYAYLLVML
jgi:hypothetical protein